MLVLRRIAGLGEDGYHPHAQGVWAGRRRGAENSEEGCAASWRWSGGIQGTFFAQGVVCCSVCAQGLNVQCPTVKELTPIQKTEVGKIRRVRGIAYTTRVNPSFSNRVCLRAYASLATVNRRAEQMIDAAKEVLNRFTPNVFIYTDHYRGKERGLCVPRVCSTCIRTLCRFGHRSPGYALILVSEFTGGGIVASEVCKEPEKNQQPDDIGEQCALMLLNEVAKVRVQAALGDCVTGWA